MFLFQYGILIKLTEEYVRTMQTKRTIKRKKGSEFSFEQRGKQIRFLFSYRIFTNGGDGNSNCNTDFSSICWPKWCVFECSLCLFHATCSRGLLFSFIFHALCWLLHCAVCTSRTPLSSISNIINGYYFIIVKHCSFYHIVSNTHYIGIMVLLLLLLFVLHFELTTSLLYFYVVSLQYSSLAFSLIFFHSLFVDSRRNENRISYIYFIYINKWCAFVTNLKWCRDIKQLFFFELVSCMPCNSNRWP